MPIKAKPIDPRRAAAMAQRRLGTSEGKQGEMNSFYYDDVRRRAQLEKDEDDASSSSSAGSSVVAPAVPTAAPTADLDSDEELLMQARERTQRLLYPESDKRYVAKPYHNRRMEAYEKAKDAERKRQKQLALQQAEADDNDGAAPTPSTAEADVVAPPLPAPKAAPKAASPAPAKEVKTAPQSVEPAVVHSTTTPIANKSSAKNVSDDPLRRDFTKLLELLGEDVEREHAERAESQRHPASSDAPQQLKPTGYRPPARTFAEAQEDKLLALYEEWCGQDEAGPVFIATDHFAEAFTLAAARTEALASPGFMDEPASLEELAILPSGKRSNGGARTIAASAQEELNRFLQSVAWTERLVRDPRFVKDVARHLYDKHKVFLKHYGNTDTPSSVVEHTHEEYEVYETFGTHYSEIMLHVLKRHVHDFDEEEFVAALYDTPVADDYGNGTPANVLSYAAWRLILALSDFESFFALMMDYIQEEYKVGADAGEKLAVGGARGLRALLRSTYQRDPDVSAMIVSSEEAQVNGSREADKSASVVAMADTPSSPLFRQEPDKDLQRAPSIPSSSIPGSPAAHSASAGSPPLHPNQWARPSSSQGNPQPATHGGSVTSSPAGNAHLFPTPPTSAGGVARTRRDSKPSARVGRDLPPIENPPDAPKEEGPPVAKGGARSRSRSVPRLGLGPGKVGPVPRKPSGVPGGKRAPSTKRGVSPSGTSAPSKATKPKLKRSS